ncbi:BCCT family transporter [Aestuariibacter sp. AA17]|uniref:BCCT family transporter n=1 Tax=Fluctibacter corallii TaxID=2984329 RepID=A0ABT3A4I5_9ALTE|nr:BCCT family transporter [Aestuariibacter sp. AA17]MCV2883589.1 BCCT family transporter [Aestuariibacter sp. AA17]
MTIPNNAERPSSHLNKQVFLPASGTIVALLLFALLAPNAADTLFQHVQGVIVTNGSWFYVLTVTIIVITVLYLGLSRYGEIRLGPDHAQPDYSLLTWLSMLFAAGMGIGLMFFGVAEPLMHFLAPPTAPPETILAVKEAMRTTFFHWGFHAWSIYAVVALVLAYFSFRHQLPLTLRSALYPIIGDRIYGWAGHAVDIFAVTSTIFGVATSLGIGAAQINAGLAYMTDIEVNTANQVWMMAAVTLLAVVSVSTGLDKGIRRLSELNMILAVALLAFILLLGPTVFLLQAYLQNTGAYLSDIVRNTFNLFAYEKTDWIGGWTIFYWGWWLAWAPFVGLFIARISRGRTIREFVIGVLLVPTAFTLFWMTVFGNGAIDLVFAQGESTLADLVNEDASIALFAFLEYFPFANILSVVAICMVVVFFVTSCDSGAMVVDMLCSHGENNTPLWQRIYWAVGVGLVASVLLYAGGLNALQTMTIAAALPFAIVLILAIFGLVRALRVDGFKRDSLKYNVSQTQPSQREDDWRERLHTIVAFPNRDKVDTFIKHVVETAFNTVADEFKKNQLEVEIHHRDKGMTFVVKHGDEQDFEYSVYRRRHIQPEYANAELLSDEDDDANDSVYFRAEVHLREGGQDYDIMGWSRNGVINDIIDQYQKHQHFLHLLR